METSVAIAPVRVGTCRKTTTVVRNCKFTTSITADFVTDFPPLPPSLLVQNTLRPFTSESTPELQNRSKSRRQVLSQKEK